MEPNGTNPQPPIPESIPELETKCLTCFGAVPIGAYFCPHCGTSLKDKGPSTSLGKQITVYAISLLLPPLGYWYGWKYLKQSDAASKKIGWAAIILTTASIILTTWGSVSILNSVNQQLNGITQWNIP